MLVLKLLGGFLEFGPGSLELGSPGEVCDLGASLLACDFGFRASALGPGLSARDLAFRVQVRAFGAVFIISGVGFGYRLKV